MARPEPHFKKESAGSCSLFNGTWRCLEQIIRCVYDRYILMLFFNKRQTCTAPVPTLTSFSVLPELLFPSGTNPSNTPAKVFLPHHYRVNELCNRRTSRLNNIPPQHTQIRHDCEIRRRRTRHEEVPQWPGSLGNDPEDNPNKDGAHEKGVDEVDRKGLLVTALWLGFYLLFPLA